MFDSILFALLAITYIGIAYFIIKLALLHISRRKKFFRILILSFLFALFCGPGIVGSGGNPGFGFPAPVLVALAFMADMGYYRGVIFELYFLGFWWVVIFILMWVRELIIRNEKQAE